MARLWLQSQPTDSLQLNLRYKYFQRDQYRISSATALTRNNGSLQEFGAEPLPQDRTLVRALAHRMVFSEQARTLFGERDYSDYQIDVERVDAEVVMKTNCSSDRCRLAWVLTGLLPVSGPTLPAQQVSALVINTEQRKRKMKKAAQKELPF